MTNGLAPLWILVRAATAEAGSGRDISWRHETRIPYLAFNHQRIFGRFGVRIQTVRYMNERPIVSGTRISTWANGFGSRMHVLRSEAVHVMSYCRWYRTPRLTKILRYRLACEYRRRWWLIVPNSTGVTRATSRKWSSCDSKNCNNGAACRACWWPPDLVTTEHMYAYRPFYPSTCHCYLYQSGWEDIVDAIDSWSSCKWTNMDLHLTWVRHRLMTAMWRLMAHPTLVMRIPPICPVPDDSGLHQSCSTGVWSIQAGNTLLFLLFGVLWVLVDVWW